MTQTIDAAVADRLEISDLTARFTDAVNRRSPADVGALFADEGEWHVPGLPVAAGPAAAEEQFAGLLGTFTRLVQLLHGGTVTVTGDTATATWYITEFAGTDGGKAFHFIGVYRDGLTRTRDGWRFATRAFDFLYRARGDADAKWYPHPLASAVPAT